MARQVIESREYKIMLFASGFGDYEGKLLKKRATRVLQLTSVSEAPTRCHMLVVGSNLSSPLGESLWETAGCLTVGESSGFAQQGGMLELSMRDQHLQLIVNLQASRKSGVQIGSDLLALSTIIGDH